MIRFARVIEVTTDELLGVRASKDNGNRLSLKLLRRAKKIETLPPSQQKTLLKTIDTFLKDAERQKSDPVRTKTKEAKQKSLAAPCNFV